MIAIHTKTIPASNTRGTRIKAYTYGFGDHKGFTATIAYPYAESYELAHFEAVKELVKKNQLDWDLSDMRYGTSADGNGYSFCFNHSIVKG